MWLIATILLSVFVTACSNDSKQSRAPGQPTMNELMHRRAQKSRAENERYNARLIDARTLTAAQISQLENDLKSKPEDFTARETLLIHYSAKKDIDRRDRHLLWLIEHDPKKREWAIRPDPPVSPAAFEAGKRLWLKSLRTADKAGYREAALFVATGDKPLAEKILLEGAAKFPDPREWSMQLGQLYFQVLVGSEGPLPLGVIHRVSLASSQSAYAQEVRRKLEATADVDLLATVARGLAGLGTNLYWRQQIAFDPFALAAHYADRVDQLAPETRLAKGLRFSMDRNRRVQELYRQGRAEDILPKASEPDRWYLLPLAMDRQFRLGNLDATEKYAREYLTLATKDPAHLHYTRAVSSANMQLGKVSMRRGDLRRAGEYMMASLGTPGSDEAKFMQFDMALARTLVDAGQRNIVAEYLDRCSEIAMKGEQYKRWADEIRKGINPDLIPYATGCANEPC